MRLPGLRCSIVDNIFIRNIKHARPQLSFSLSHSLVHCPVYLLMIIMMAMCTSIYKLYIHITFFPSKLLLNEVKMKKKKVFSSSLFSPSHAMKQVNTLNSSSNNGQQVNWTYNWNMQIINAARIVNDDEEKVKKIRKRQE